MDIPSFRAEHALTQADFAAALTRSGSPATQSLISQWEKGEVTPPPERWAVIEKVTGGKVTRQDLRPDLFGVPPASAGAVSDPDDGRIAPPIETA